MNQAIEYAKNIFNSIDKEGALIEYSTFDNGVKYILHATIDDKPLSLIYELLPYADKEGGDAQFYIPEFTQIDLRFEQEQSEDSLNKDSDIARDYFLACLQGRLYLHVSKVLFMTKRKLVIKSGQNDSTEGLKLISAVRGA